MNYSPRSNISQAHIFSSVYNKKPNGEAIARTKLRKKGRRSTFIPKKISHGDRLRRAEPH